MKNKTIDYEEKREKIRDRQIKIANSCPIKSVPFAYENGTNHKTGKNYTPKEIKDYQNYQDKRNKWLENHEEYQKLEREMTQCITALYHDETLLTKIAKADAKKFIEENPNSFIFITSYSDNDGETFSIMEHGNIFKKLNHITISHH